MGKLNIEDKTALKSMESWLKGKTELVYRVVYNAGAATNKNRIDVEKLFPSISRKKAKAVNITHMIWGSAALMDKYFLLFAEREGNGGSVAVRNSTLTAVINSITITLNQPINWRRNDRACGQKEIVFCEPANGNGTSHSPDLVTFNIKI